MKYEDLFYGMNYINTSFIVEAETVTRLKGSKKMPPLRRCVLIAALITTLLMLIGCGAAIYITFANEPWASIPVVEGVDVPTEDIQITITEVTPSYLCYRCDIDNFGYEEKAVVFYTDVPCTIERKTDTGWQALPKQITDAARKADEVLTDGHYEGKFQWAAHYGYLDVGHYRITASIIQGHEDFVLEFEIEDSMRSESLETAEDLVNREFWHIQVHYSTEYGTLDNVPDDAKEQFIRDAAQPEQCSEYWRCGDDYLFLTYFGDRIAHGMMYKDGTKYALIREKDSFDSPIVGWTPWPDMDLNVLTNWRYTLEEAQFEGDVSCRNDGTVDTVVLTRTQNGSNGFDVDITRTTTLQVMPTSQEEIKKILDEQNTNVWQVFSWAADKQTHTAMDVPFVNTTPNPISTATEAFSLAENECSVDYSQAMIYRDETAGIWKIEYQILYGYQGYQYVYLNDEGITVRVSSADPKE